MDVSPSESSCKHFFELTALLDNFPFIDYHYDGLFYFSGHYFWYIKNKFVGVNVVHKNYGFYETPKTMDPTKIRYFDRVAREMFLVGFATGIYINYKRLATVTAVPLDILKKIKNTQPEWCDIYPSISLKYTLSYGGVPGEEDGEYPVRLCVDIL